jgi:hypothetical protein
MKPTTSKADNVIESFILFSLCQSLQRIPNLRHFDAALSRPIRSATRRLTAAATAGLIQIKAALIHLRGVS